MRSSRRCGPEELSPLDSTPFGDKQCGGFGRLAQRVEIDILVEAVHRSAGRSKTQTGDVIIQPKDPRVRKRGKAQTRTSPAVDSLISSAESRLRFRGLLQFVSFR